MGEGGGGVVSYGLPGRRKKATGTDMGRERHRGGEVTGKVVFQEQLGPRIVLLLCEGAQIYTCSYDKAVKYSHTYTLAQYKPYLLTAGLSCRRESS